MKNEVEYDINLLKRLLEREKRIKLICSELNSYVDLKSRLHTVLGHLKELVGCEAISIRLHCDGDYPYYVFNGFSESFIRKENSLCALDSSGNRIILPGGKDYVLECMCGHVIRGSSDNTMPFFTKKGSFFTNSTSELLKDVDTAKLLRDTRNYCNLCGYESVALIPIPSENNNIGLIQLNDKRRGMFNDELLEYLEMIAEQVALAVRNSLIYTRLREAMAEVKKLNKKLEKAAKTDPLTGLINRRAFIAMTDHEKKRFARSKKPFSLIMCDIDHFKWINDSMGHDTGDYILIELAKLLLNSLRAQDTLCRWGGEEFIILLPETDLTGGKNLAEKLRKIIEAEKFHFNAQEITVTMSFGITSCEKDITIYTYIKEADECMYMAKKNGRNRVVVNKKILGENKMRHIS
jgi:diguanylate cyclase (GGDEF)-like protein